MKPSSPHRLALARVATNLSLGLAPFALLAGLHPAMPAKAALPVWWCLLLCFALAGCLNIGARDHGGGTALRRPLACLLLGSSLAAIPWKSQDLALFPAILATGFVSRWWLYALETRDLVIADRRKIALPCLATRYRRAITWITGAVIPLLVVSGLPSIPLLTLSFGLTVFGQWTVAGESCLTPVRSRIDAPGRVA